MIELRDVELRRGRRAILRDLDLRLEAGELLAVLGPNGAGKSTLLAALAGELRPSRGELKFDGLPLHRLPAPERARRLAVLPQECAADFPFTAAEIVALGRLPHGGAVDDDRWVEQSLRAAGVLHLAHRLVPSLSGGERQRVHFARALAQLAGTDASLGRCLLLDEPTSSLDLEHQHQVLSTAQALALGGVGVVAILHDPNLAAAYADRVLLLHDGRAAALGQPDEVLTPARMDAVFRVHADVVPHPRSHRPLLAFTRADRSATPSSPASPAAAAAPPAAPDSRPRSARRALL